MLFHKTSQTVVLRLVFLVTYFRALSHDPDRETPDRNVVKSPSFNIGDTNNENITTDEDSLHPIRPRASSYGGDRKHLRQKGVHADRQPFADYTFFPDKDPSVATIGSGLNRSQVLFIDIK